MGDIEKQVPKYRKISELLQRFAREECAPGDRFPTQRELMRRYDCSFATVDRALRELVAAGVIIRTQGRGSFVCDSAGLQRRGPGRQVALVLTRNVSCQAHSFYTEILFELCDTLSRNGYSFAYRYTDDSTGSRALIEELAGGRNFCGAALIGTVTADFALALRRRGLPVVVVDNRIDRPELCCVVGDNENGAVRMVSHLIAGGHRRIAFVSEPLHTTFLERFLGYCNALLAHGIPVDQQLIQKNLRFDLVARDLEPVLAARPTAFFAANDSVAIAVCRELRTRKLSVPRDYSVAGFDGDYIGAQWQPKLTTMTVPRRLMGRTAAEKLLSQLRGEAAVTTVLPVEFYSGESVRTLENMNQKKEF